MICSTVREGMECPLMEKDGCSYDGGCQPIVEKCLKFTIDVEKTVGGKKEIETLTSGPCKKITTSTDGKMWLCRAYVSPASKWKLGNCNHATHVLTIEEQKKLLNPLKASRRKRRDR